MQIGEALGRLAKPAMSRLLAQSPTWMRLQPWRGSVHLRRLMDICRETLPDCWNELEGMARAMDMDPADVFLWNCRTDLPGVDEDCSTSVAINRLNSRMVAQRFDADTCGHAHCHLVQVSPDGKPGFLAVYSPGTLPGHRIAVNDRGLVLATDMLAARQPTAGIPGILLCRAALDARSLPEAVDRMIAMPRAGSAHHIFGWAGEFVMLSIEMTPETHAWEPIPGKYAHANHLIHPSLATKPQGASASSRHRQAVVAQRLADLPDYPGEDDLLGILTDDALDAGASTVSLCRFNADHIHIEIFGHGNALLQRQEIAVVRD